LTGDCNEKNRGCDLLVVSPHRDDAAFSVGLTIRRWLACGWPVKIINCYTISEYAPHRSELNRAAVSDLRRAEDLAFAQHLGDGIEFVDLNLLDAPLRLCCPVDEVCNRALAPDRVRVEIELLGDHLRRIVNRGVLLIPLSVGNHVDHIIARQTCIRLADLCSLAFYEDLPYSALAGPEGVAEARLATETLLGRSLQSIVIASGDASVKKMEVVKLYPSQVTESEVEQIKGYTAYTGGERIWLDETSSHSFQTALGSRAGNDADKRIGN